MKLLTPGACKCCGGPIHFTSQLFCKPCAEEIYMLTLEYVKKARKRAIRDVAKRHKK